MRLLFIAPELGLGGAERQWAILLPELQHRGLTVGLLTLRGEGRDFEAVRAAGVEAWSARMRRHGDWSAWLRAWRLASRWKPDLVVSLPVNAQALAHLLARRLGIPHVTAEHTNGISPRRHRRALLRLVAPRVSRVVAVDQSQFDALRSRGYRSDAVQVIPNAPSVDLAALTPPPETRRLLGIAAGEFVAILVARLRPEKRVGDFIEAVRLARSRVPRLRGLVVGGGPEYERAREMAARAEGAVTALGPREDAVDLMYASDVVCLASTHEAMPMSLLEAMAVGRPTVCTRVGGVAAVVEDGETGLVVPPRDPIRFAAALETLAIDPGLASSLGAAGRERQGEKFDLATMVVSYEKSFMDLTAGVQPR